MTRDLAHPDTWSQARFLGAGSYNVALQSNDRQSVLKIQKHDLMRDKTTGQKPDESRRPKTDTAERAVRLWNLINDDIDPPACLVSLDKLNLTFTIDDAPFNITGVGSAYQYIEGVQASDEEIQNKIMNIFNRTGRIITDATSPGNVLRTPQGKIVCVDIGMALEMEQRDEVFLAEEGRARSKSITSLEAWQKLQGDYTPFFSKSREHGYPKTVDTIKTLLFIKANRPDITDVNFLKTQPELVEQLANAFDASDDYETSHALQELDRATPTSDESTPYEIDDLEFEEEEESDAIQNAYQLLKEEQPITLDNIKLSCIDALEKYISSHGQEIEKHGQFQPARITQWLRESMDVGNRINQAQTLIKSIEGVTSLDELETCIEEAVTKQAQKPKPFPALEMCNIMTDVARHDMPPSFDLGLGPTVAI